MIELLGVTFWIFIIFIFFRLFFPDFFNNYKKPKKWLGEIDNEINMRSKKTSSYTLPKKECVFSTTGCGYIPTINEINFINCFENIVLEKLNDIADHHFQKGFFFNKLYKIHRRIDLSYIEWSVSTNDDASMSGFSIKLNNENLSYSSRNNIKQKISINDLNEKKLNDFFVFVYKNGPNEFTLH